MQTAKIVFASNYKIFSLLIMLFTWSRWSHCGIVDGDYIIDATLATGVRRIPFEEWKTHYRYYEIQEIPVRTLSTSLAWARKQVGKKYDPLGILSLILHKPYEERDKFFCSELVAEFVSIQYKPWKLSPNFLYQLCKVLKGWIT